MVVVVQVPGRLGVRSRGALQMTTRERKEFFGEDAFVALDFSVVPWGVRVDPLVPGTDIARRAACPGFVAVSRGVVCIVRSKAPTRSDNSATGNYGRRRLVVRPLIQR